MGELLISVLFSVLLFLSYFGLLLFIAVEAAAIALGLYLMLCDLREHGFRLRGSWSRR